MLPKLVDFLNYIQPTNGPLVFQSNVRFAFFPFSDSPSPIMIPPELASAVTHQPTSSFQINQGPSMNNDNLTFVAQNLADQVP